MDITNLRFTDKINKNENDHIIYNELIELIKNQFDFINIGVNYITQYNEIPSELYDWLLQEINAKYLEINEINTIYKDIYRVRIVSKSLYEFLFVDILDFIEKIDTSLDVSQLRVLTFEKLKSLKLIDTDIENQTLNFQLIKWSIISDSLDGNLELLSENYWPMLVNYIEIRS
jgi:hypothetical protein